MKKLIMILMLILVLIPTAFSWGGRWYLPGDFNRDGCVDMIDFSYLANHYGAERGDPLYHWSYDLWRDGVIDEKDIQVWSWFYGRCKR